MKLVVGLGNPGNKYKDTRHNVGFVVVDELAKNLGAGEFKLNKKGETFYSGDDKGTTKLFKPMTFMNSSGKSVSYAMKKHPELSFSDLYIVHDDLDIPLGSFKIQKGKGPKDHKGLLDIYQKLGSKDFWHVRVGIEGKARKISGEDYVLAPFKAEEKQILNKVLKEIVEEIKKNE